MCFFSPHRPTAVSTLQVADNSFIKKLKTSGRSLVVFYGSQTGTGEEFAGRLAKEGIRYQLKGMVADPEECDMVSVRLMFNHLHICYPKSEEYSLISKNALLCSFNIHFRINRKNSCNWRPSRSRWPSSVWRHTARVIQPIMQWNSGTGSRATLIWVDWIMR